MKIEKITLSRQELVEKDGEYELVEKDKEAVPCVITNRALQLAKQMGVTKTSLMTDLMNLAPSEEKEDVQVNDLDDERVLQAIYVGYIGGQLLQGNKEPKYNFDEFIERYNAGTVERAVTYNKILAAEDNKFAKEVQKSTSKKVQKGEKK